MHVDVWMPGKLATMYDLTQFVESMIVADANSDALAKVFIE